MPRSGEDYLHFTGREEWRAWLEEHHREPRTVWLLFDKKQAGRACISYEAAVEEALCFGWIDSIIKRIDETRYARKFTPRTDTRKWSAINLRRFQKVVAEGRMTEAGLAKLDPGTEPTQPPPRQPFLELPDFFREALARNRKACEFFEQLAPSYRRRFIGWVSTAKKPETRQKRLKEALSLLERREKLGLK